MYLEYSSVYVYLSRMLEKTENFHFCYIYTYVVKYIYVKKSRVYIYKYLITYYKHILIYTHVFTSLQIFNSSVTLKNLLVY